MPPFEGYEDCQAWAAVELPTVPWFIVHVLHAKGEGLPLSLQISSLNHVASFLQSLTPKDKVLSIQAAMPAGYTGQRIWSVSELQAVWRATALHGSENYPVWVLESTDGAVVTEPSLQGCESITREQQIYARLAEPVASC